MKGLMKRCVLHDSNHSAGASVPVAERIDYYEYCVYLARTPLAFRCGHESCVNELHENKVTGENESNTNLQSPAVLLGHGYPFPTAKPYWLDPGWPQSILKSPLCQRNGGPLRHAAFQPSSKPGKAVRPARRPP